MRTLYPAGIKLTLTIKILAEVYHAAMNIQVTQDDHECWPGFSLSLAYESGAHNIMSS